ncbi:MAG: pyruvate dehydrogenase complex dihydrolipoamide acetyltransferase [Alphaproteobacteria bacterium]|nr:pyruvate dehydrogenase complex dihydrolipoamide acetyltransferase [Alphaproteobacteria bacterium]MBL6939120.1 pyruvate dehydrogenase complex dihydrolipoamide acetyltransferase [Alphaproteobacteria bacterium]MBL7096637.1 pyruvate dehydrogenase complex dihydrolipoamide acetyltransferase [Alphaproteobacteria bacterium]
MATQILMPALSPTMEEGKLAKWLVKEGDTVKSGDILAEIETDKATMEFEAVDEGKIGKLLVAEGTEGVKVNAPIATLLAEGEKPGATVDISSAMDSIKSAVQEAAPQKPTPKAAPAASTPAQAAPTPAAAKPTAAPAAKPDAERIFASPLARKIAAQKGVELSTVHGSGPRGRIVKADVEGAKPGVAPAAKSPAVAPVPAGQPIAGIAPLPDARAFFKSEDYDEIPHDQMRKTIARRLTSAKTLIPHFYLTINTRIDNLMDTRARLNAASPKENGFKLSVNDFVVKACALSLMRVPEVNASWTDTAMLRHKHADVGVAVALDFGLITPIVFRAEEKGLAAISNEVKSLAERARNKKLKPSEFEGGGFSVSNLGMFGIKDFTAVINPPQAAILAVGAGEKRPVVVGDKIEIQQIMTVTLSCDHRVIDGATGARFLQAFKQFIEEPAAMLL